MDGSGGGASSYTENAIRVIQGKQGRQLPEIDFTLHKMEDGTEVSTQERVCKGMVNTRTPGTRTH